MSDDNVVAENWEDGDPVKGLEQRVEQIRILKRRQEDKEKLIEKIKEEESLKSEEETTKSVTKLEGDAAGPSQEEPKRILMRRPKTDRPNADSSKSQEPHLKLTNNHRNSNNYRGRKKAKDVVAGPPKTLEERQADYQAARDRILGPEYKPETNVTEIQVVERSKSPEAIVISRSQMPQSHHIPSHGPVPLPPHLQYRVMQRCHPARFACPPNFMNPEHPPAPPQLSPMQPPMGVYRQYPNTQLDPMHYVQIGGTPSSQNGHPMYPNDAKYFSMPNMNYPPNQQMFMNPPPPILCQQQNQQGPMMNFGPMGGNMKNGPRNNKPINNMNCPPPPQQSQVAIHPPDYSIPPPTTNPIPFGCPPMSVNQYNGGIHQNPPPPQQHQQQTQQRQQQNQFNSPSFMGPITMWNPEQGIPSHKEKSGNC
ncbi:unnamed protein product [Caenorhabditis bovis]|uniref:SUZ domain-containing protein n=1 Tax=Caenorhabditis bovis TaxID=2654633 RepID=A0A8S1EJM0_9PELO|nr:unnamed protein product [Caenorhabditis bovis]